MACNKKKIAKNIQMEKEAGAKACKIYKVTDISWKKNAKMRSYDFHRMIDGIEFCRLEVTNLVFKIKSSMSLQLWLNKLLIYINKNSLG